ncbi:hypothetical protein ABG768_020526 [Culter alburnus]|uniref:NAD(P)(+)--arginine ADP-ribosyltransferase n=1 Tax=Culter alburnus TaxID=194366 RepID=A0AAW2B191_CULAL
MALNSVDDQFEGCTKEMADLVKTKLLETELHNSDQFKKAWQEGKTKAKKPQDNLKMDHSIAIYVYADNIFSVFNEASRNDKESYINKSYKWYFLHFLLTEAIQILKTKQKKCFFTYRGVNKKFNENVQNTEVRFGSFASSSLNKEVAEIFSAGKSCFEIKTCYGAKVADYSRIPDEEEVLIPPYEKFKVTAVKTKSVDKDKIKHWSEK